MHSLKTRFLAANALAFVMFGLCSLGFATRPCSDALPQVATELFFTGQKHEATSLDGGKVLLIEDDPILRTSVLLGNPERLTSSDSVMVMFPGMGGALKKFGIAASAGQFARSMLSANIYPIGVQNWVYFGAKREDVEFLAERKALSERFSDLEVQMEAITDLLDRITSHVEAMGKPIDLLTRSNGSGLILQWISRAAKWGGRSYQVAQRIRTIYVSGLNSPLPEHRGIWIAAEEKMEADDPGSLDPWAKLTDRRIYERVSWANKNLNAPIVTDRQICRVVALISAQDRFAPIDMQVLALREFHLGHPEVPMVFAYTDLEHDPLRAFDYFYLDESGSRKRVKASSAERFKEILNRVNRGDFGPPVRGQVTEFVHPNYSSALKRLPKPLKNKPAADAQTTPVNN